jgi:sugar/nucleoside kinase (ribokinase family)
VESPAQVKAELEALHGKTGQCLIVTLGGDGVLWAKDGKSGHVPSLEIKPVDTVGAGDTFCGYLAQGLDAGHGVRHGRPPGSGGRCAGLSHTRRAAVDSRWPMSTPGSDLFRGGRPAR